MSLHPFDQAIALDAMDKGVFRGHCGTQYWNMVGPYGGLSAALVLNAVLQHPDRLGEPIALTANYAAALAQGPFTITARAARTNRSTQHWVLEMLQDDAAGDAHTVLTGTVVTARRRDTWRSHDIPMPAVPPAASLEPAVRPGGSIAWLDCYEVRGVAGGLPARWDGSENAAPADSASLTRLWMRDKPPRPLDACALAALADLFFPRVFLRRARRVPVGTVSITTYLHAGAAELRDCGSGFVLGQVRGQVYRDGFFDHTAQLWSESGVPLATSSQIVYYKE